jgi:hypothetical protein
LLSAGLLSQPHRRAALHRLVALMMRQWVEGFTTDEARTEFARALERKHGRFAFPDEFNEDVLAKLRERILTAHGKVASDHGEAYRSIHTVRAIDWCFISSAGGGYSQQRIANRLIDTGSVAAQQKPRGVSFERRDFFRSKLAVTL